MMSWAERCLRHLWINASMWAEAKLFNRLKYLLKHSLNPRSSLRHPDHQARRWWWQTPVICCQTYFSKASFLAASACPHLWQPQWWHRCPQWCYMQSLSLTLSHEYLCIFIWSRRALRGLTKTATLETSALRGCNTLCGSGRPLHHVSSCPAPQGQGESWRHQQHLLTLPEPTQHLHVLCHKTSLSPWGTASTTGLGHVLGLGDCTHEVVAYLG